MPGIELTESFFNELCSFLSSVVAVLWMTFFFRLAEPCSDQPFKILNIAIIFKQDIGINYK